MSMAHTAITIHTTTLSRKEQEDIRRIASLCRRADGLSLSCPEDGDEYWLLEEGKIPAAFMAVYKTEETIWECYAFTHPDFRRKGYFSALLEQVLRYSETQGEPELCLVTDNRCPAAAAALQKLQAELWYEEYMMELDLAAAAAAFEDKISSAPASLPNTELDINVGTASDGVLVCARRPAKNGKPGGVSGPDTLSDICVSCRLSLNGTDAYMYSLETVPSLRRQGLAGCFLRQLIHMLGDKGIRRLRLRVSGSNELALNLYRKTGFRITETLSYYLY